MRPRANLGGAVRLALAIVCFVLSALAFRRALVSLLGAVVAWMAAAVMFAIGSMLFVSATWSGLRAWLERRRQRRQQQGA